MKKLFLIFFLLFALLTAQLPAQQVVRHPIYASSSTLNTGLVAYWKLDEASGSRADSKGSNTLTDNNTVTSNTGIISNAAQFTSGNSEYLSITDNSTFDFTTAMSASFWVYRDTLTQNQVYLGKWTYSTDGEWVIQTGQDAGKDAQLTIFIATSDVDSGSGCRMDFNDANQSLSTWYHIVVIFDGSLTGDGNRLKVYQNGSQLSLVASSGAVPSSLRNGTANFYISQFGGSLTRYFDGRLDELGLWNKAVTSSEVSELYNSGAGKTCCPF